MAEDSCSTKMATCGFAAEKFRKAVQADGMTNEVKQKSTDFWPSLSYSDQDSDVHVTRSERWAVTD
jgi:hypothetical protein